ncbi:hypothetical protein Vadar_013227 [Vaccinium darrowii]|uniref:Uncharacterized protein n=1 Tax=Vaccinium darrowii TaxID=229202 RepID=A0ACB7Z3J4_9ERIC|nr:hypothetical protein Vadar_013227 [Vaccinium darrowii]
MQFTYKNKALELRGSNLWKVEQVSARQMGKTLQQMKQGFIAQVSSLSAVEKEPQKSQMLELWSLSQLPFLTDVWSSGRVGLLFKFWSSGPTPILKMLHGSSTLLFNPGFHSLSVVVKAFLKREAMTHHLFELYQLAQAHWLQVE